MLQIIRPPEPIPGHVGIPMPPMLWDELHKEWRLGMIYRQPPIDTVLPTLASEELFFIAANEIYHIPDFCMPDGSERDAFRFITGEGHWCKLVLPIYTTAGERIAAATLYLEGDGEPDEADIFRTLADIILILHAEVGVGP